jgi:guanylate kinase
MRVNIDGAATIRQLVPEAVLIFIAPPSLEELGRRLRERQTESADEIERRLSVAQHEMQQADMFDYVVFNHAGRLNETVEQICGIIAAEKQRVWPRRITL